MDDMSAPAEAGADRVRLADFMAREAERLGTPPPPRFAKPQRAPYEAPEGWRSWAEFTRYSGSARSAGEPA